MALEQAWLTQGRFCQAQRGNCGLEIRWYHKGQGLCKLRRPTAVLSPGLVSTHLNFNQLSKLEHCTGLKIQDHVNEFKSQFFCLLTMCLHYPKPHFKNGNDHTSLQYCCGTICGHIFKYVTHVHIYAYLSIYVYTYIHVLIYVCRYVDITHICLGTS